MKKYKYAILAAIVVGLILSRMFIQYKMNILVILVEKWNAVEDCWDNGWSISERN